MEVNKMYAYAKVRTWIIEFKKGKERGKIEIKGNIVAVSKEAEKKIQLGYKMIIIKPKEEEDMG